jgi:hypothetical protein
MRPRSFCELLPVTPAHYSYLIALHAEVSNTPDAIPWRWRGETPHPERFANELWLQVLAHYVAQDRRTGAPVGYLVAYDPDLRNGHCKVAVCFSQRTPGYRLRAMDSARSLFEMLFENWPFRKLYMERYSQPGESPLMRSPLRLEATLDGHAFVRGSYVNLSIYSVSRADFGTANARWQDGDQNANVG